ncbi:MAG: DUF808 domain-containing protein [Deltaproteobacteria bacterium]|nr:DUF808 domain-containing protein [Deltaproteobacteria bacterium]
MQGIFALLDDIASLLDDVAVLTKVAAKQTAGVVGDDLALNAEQVAGVPASRELPVVWAVAKGSLVNKAILVPVALGISAVTPWLVRPFLMVGGAYLCFEGVEKIAHAWQHRGEAEARRAALVERLSDPGLDLVTYEKDKIRGAIRTDFILSAEILVIALGTVAGASFGRQVASLAVISVLMTAGVYGLVAAIVKLDDLGLYLARRRRALPRWVGEVIVAASPWFIKVLSVVGTAAMFLVGGHILAGGIAPAHRAIDGLQSALGDGSLGASLAGALAEGALGVAAGALVRAVVALLQARRAAKR